MFVKLILYKLSVENNSYFSWKSFGFTSVILSMSFEYDAKRSTWNASS